MIASSQSINDIVLSQGQLQTLITKGTKKIIYKMVVNTTDSDQMQDVKFYPEYEISLQLSAKLNLNVNLNN